MDSTRGQRRRGAKVVGVLMALALVAVACGDDNGGGGDVTTGSPVDTPGGTGEGGSEFDELVEAARASDHRVRQALDSYTAEDIEAREQAFEERFGFPLTLENEPGHQSQDIPAKIIQSGQAGRGVVDMSEGASTNFVEVFQQGFTRRPNWEAIEAEWPVIPRLRDEALEVVNDDGERMGDYCMMQAQLPWVPVFNTERVDAAELEGFVWEDLTEPEWMGRLALDGRAAGLFVFPFAPGWDEDRLREFTEGMGANQPTIVSGGSSGVVQALLQGEGDIGIAVSRVVESQKAIGAPLDYVIPEDFLPVSHRATCMMEPGVNDPAMVELYWAWLNAEFIYEQGAAGEPTDPRLGPEDAEYFEIADRVQEAGLGSEELAYARTPEEDALISGYRDVAIQGMATGAER